MGRGAKPLDISGNTFGYLTAIASVGKIGNSSSHYWECICSCGNFVVVSISKLRNGHTKSCGCLQREKASKAKSTHGMSRTSEYKAYLNIKVRCYYEKSKDYTHYGAKGIEMCDRWLESFENFIEDVGKKPTIDHTIDRIDGEGDYEPANCRWVLRTTQCHNKKFSKKTGFKGVSETENGRFSANISANNKRVYIGTFDTPEEAAKAYNNKAIELHGVGFSLNVI